MNHLRLNASEMRLNANAMGPGTLVPQPSSSGPAFRMRGARNQGLGHDLARGPGAQALNEGRGAGAEHRMAPVRGDFGQGNEHKGAAGELWVRQNKAPCVALCPGPAEAAAAIVQDVDVEGARA